MIHWSRSESNLGKLLKNQKIEDEIRFGSSHIAGINLERMKIETDAKQDNH